MITQTRSLGRGLWGTSFAWVALSVLAVAPARGDLLWDMTPYRIQLFVATADDGRLPVDYAETLADEVVDRLDALIGAAWLLQPNTPDAHLRQLLLDHLDHLTAEDLPAPALQADKVLLVAVRAESSGTTIHAREYDVRTQTWSAPVERNVAQARPLTTEVVRAVLASFTPLAKIEKVDGKAVTLKLQAAGLPPRDPTIAFVTADDLFRPIVRHHERDGSLKKLQQVPYTFLLVNEVTAAGAQSTVYSGMRSALAARKRARSEQLALKIKSPPGTTRLELRSRTEPDRPLVGYEVFAYGPNDKTTVSLGRSNSRGEVEVPPGPQPIRILVVKSGGEFLARLPVVPGLEPVLNTPLARDDERVAAEGFIVGLQEELVDLVVRREVLMALIRARLDQGKLEEAEKLNEELAALRTREQFALLIDAQKQRTVSKDQTVQRKIDRLFTDTLALVNNFMASAPLDDLQNQLRQAKQASASAEPAPAPVPPAPEAAAPAGEAAPATPPPEKSIGDVFKELQEGGKLPAGNPPAEGQPATPPAEAPAPANPPQEQAAPAPPAAAPAAQ